MKSKNYIFLSFFLMIALTIDAQWNPGGNFSPPINFGNNIFGTLGPIPVPVRHFTGGNLKFTTTVNNGLTNGGGAFSTGVQVGDGISIAIPAGSGNNPTATLDLFTSGQNQTFIRMDGTSLFGTTNNRFENIANLNGFWYNATGNTANGAPGPFTPQFIWNITSNEKGRLGSNGYWHFGNAAVNATNRVEIATSTGDPYFVTNNASGLKFTNLTSSKPVVPIGVGVTNQKLLSVDASGNVIMVAAPNTAPTANQGLIVTGSNVQLGGLCGSALPQITGGNRGIDLNGNNFVWQNGRSGFGITNCTPGNRVEIKSLTGINASGLRFSDLNSNSPTGFAFLTQAQGKVLALNTLGDVILVPAPGGSVANGLSINTSATVPFIELGADCNDFIGQNNSKFLNSRALYLNGNNFWMYSTNNSLGGVGIGAKPTPLTPNLCNLGNTFEVSANNQGKYGNTAASGVRLSKLTSNSPVLPLGGVNQVTNTKLLSVDKDGDIVLVAAPAGGASLGNICGLPQIPLTANWEVPLANKNYIFSEVAGGTGKVGIGVMQTLCTPGNLLEVRKGTTSNISGLRLTDLAGATPLATNGNVLSVDPLTGDVILVPDVAGGPGSGITNAQNGLSLLNPTTVEFGGLFGSATAAQLLNDREIPMNGSNIYFTGLGVANKNQFVVGQSGPIGNGKITAVSNEQTGFFNTAGMFVASDPANNSYGVFGYAGATKGPGLTNTGGSFYALNADLNRGINVITNGGNTCVGVEISALSTGGGATGISATAGGSTGDNYGVAGSAFGTTGRNYGAIFFGGGTGAQTSYGLQSTSNANGAYNVAGYFQSPNPSSVPANAPVFNAAIQAFAPTVAGFGPNWSNSWAAYLDGNLMLNGSFNGTGANNYTSDQMFKTNIDTITNAAGIIKQLQPRTYFMDTTNAYGINFSGKKQYGFIAQDVQTILPELISSTTKVAVKDSAGNIIKPAVTYKNLNYNAFFAIIVKAMQKQQNTIDSLKKKDSLQTAQIAQILSAINTLSNTVASCCSNSSIRTTGIVGKQTDVELSDKNVIVLNQNTPNPFAENTIITYNIPVDFKVAQIIFNTMDGRIIKAVDINEKGKGQINVYANDLTNGLYSYYLIVDGKIIDTKKLIKQN